MNCENFTGLTAPEDMDLGLSETVNEQDIGFSKNEEFQSSQGLLPYFDEKMMTMCQDIEMYPSDDQDVGIISTFAPPPNNQTMDYVDKTPNKLIIKSSYDPTLNEINSVEMEDNTAFDSVSYTDLSNATCNQQGPQNDHKNHFGFNASIPNADYEEFDSKEQYFCYMKYQDDIQISRMEIDVENPYINEETKPVIEEKPCFFLPSSESPCLRKIECEGADAIDAYFCQNNDSNHNPQIRAKKPSISTICSSHKNIGKIGQKQAKPFRSRKTKAEMSAMTPSEKLRHKKSQNRLNAKNCVARKNGCKNELKERVDLLKRDAKIMKKNNDILENELFKVDIFKNCHNISPYGSLNQFREILDRKKNNIWQEVFDNNSNIKLTTAHRDAEAKYSFYTSRKSEKGVPQNTFASRKSRAKTVCELTEHSLAALNCEIECKVLYEQGNLLEEFARTLNNCFEKIHLPEIIEYEGLKIFNPS